MTTIKKIRNLRSYYPKTRLKEGDHHLCTQEAEVCMENGGIDGVPGRDIKSCFDMLKWN